jgi:potassium channel
MNDLDMYKQI